MNKYRLLEMGVILAVLGLTLGLAAAGNLGGTTLETEVSLPCYVPQEVKDLVNVALGDCLDTGGILFKGRPDGKGPWVEPLGDPIDGGILFARTATVETQ